MVKRKSKKGGKPHWKTVKGIGRRCVKVLANGKWRFMPNSACGGKKKSSRSKKK